MKQGSVIVRENFIVLYLAHEIVYATNGLNIGL